MNLPGGSGRSRFLGARVLLPILLSVVGLAVARASAHGQAEEILTQRQLEYDAARRDHESRLAAWNAQQQLFSSALDGVNAARRSGDGGRLEAADRAAAVAAEELARLASRMEDAEETLVARRAALLEALDLRRNALSDQFARARAPADQARLSVLIQNLDGQYRDLESGDALRPTLVYWPSVDANPRDGPEDLRAKVGLLERRVEEAEQEIMRVDQDIARLQARLALRRRVDDSRASRDRFDGANVPVGPASRPDRDPEAPPAADTAQAAFAERPLEQQIQQLQAYRSTLEQMQEQLRTRARSIQDRISRAGVAGGVG